MKITRIAPQKRKRNRYSIFVDGAYSFSVSDDSLLKLKLQPGMEIDPSYLENVLATEEQHNAMEYIWTLLGLRSRSRKELDEALRRKEFSPGAVAFALARIEELGYLDDARFARDWARALAARNKGPEFIKGALVKKGISGDIVADILTEFRGDPESELERVTALARRKFATMKTLPPETAVRRLTGFLARRGFSLDTVRTALRQLIKDETD